MAAQVIDSNSTSHAGEKEPSAFVYYLSLAVAGGVGLSLGAYAVGVRLIELGFDKWLDKFSGG